MEDLVRKAQSGSVEAFEELVRSNTQGMYKVAIAILRNDADAADAIQETVLTCWSKLGQLRQPAYFRTWLTRVLVNCCNAQLRVRAAAVPVEHVPERADERAEHAELEWNDALGTLAHDYRVPVALYYAQGLKTREIAEVLGIPESTVTTRLARARKQLEAYYRPAGE